jgi:preprotein translocase subunit SecE
MATEEKLDKADDAALDEAPSDVESKSETDEQEAKRVSRASESDVPPPEVEGAALQLGYRRYVYGAYLAGALLVGFLAAKIGHVAWYRLGQWKAELGEPQDEYIFPVAGVIGVLVAVYYWRKADARQYADEVAEELSKVTWPTRKEVTNSTTVVVLTTLFATAFFALMDRFWGYITDQIYSF